MNKAQRIALDVYRAADSLHVAILHDIDDLHREFDDMVEQYERRLNMLHELEQSSWQIVERKLNDYVASCE